jgi:hypothetical protein
MKSNSNTVTGSSLGGVLAYIGGFLLFIVGLLLVLGIFPFTGGLTLFPFGVGVEFQILGLVAIVWQEITNLKKKANYSGSETKQTLS